MLTVITRREPAVYSEPLIDRDVLFPPNMAFPIRLLERIGYFDEHPSLRLAGEDNEWAYRALRAGDTDRLRPRDRGRPHRLARSASTDLSVSTVRARAGQLLREAPASRRSVHLQANHPRPRAGTVARPARCRDPQQGPAGHGCGSGHWTACRSARGSAERRGPRALECGSVPARSPRSTDHLTRTAPARRRGGLRPFRRSLAGQSLMRSCSHC